MLVVISHVEGDPVQRSVVRVRLLSFDKGVMLRDKVAGHRMQSHAKNSGCKVKQGCLDTKLEAQSQVKRKNNDVVEYLHSCGCLWINKHGSQGVKSRLEKDKEDLFEGIIKEPCFQLCGNIHVSSMLSLLVVVFQVISLEANAGWNGLCTVRHKSQKLIWKGGLEAEVVGKLVVSKA